MPDWLAAVIAFFSALVGVLGGVATMRHTWRSDKRETETSKAAAADRRSAEDREREAATDRQEDRLVAALRDANAVGITAERMKYEIELHKQLTEVKKVHTEQMNRLRESLITEMRKQIRDALIVYGCESAALGCKDRKHATIRPAGLIEDITI
jgi:hypothetical protein